MLLSSRSDTVSFLVTLVLVVLQVQVQQSHSFGIPSSSVYLPSRQTAIVDPSTTTTELLVSLSSASMESDPSSSFSSSLNWSPLTPTTFQGGGSPPSNGRCLPRFSKDERYLDAVLQLWNQHYDDDRNNNNTSLPDVVVETSPYEYEDADGSSLHGHLVRRRRRRQQQPENDIDSKQKKKKNNSRPGILLFHTAAGPHDVFLFYQAYHLLLAGNSEPLPEDDCVVMICDILSDANGWAWNADRTHYNTVRLELAKDDHRLLRLRVEAAVRALLLLLQSGDSKEEDAVVGVDSHRLAMMGWCLGGQALLEVPRMDLSGMDVTVRALASFHGVFRREETPGEPFMTRHDDDSGNNNTKMNNNKMMIWNGDDDPFVSKEDLEAAKTYFESAGYQVEILSMNGAKHGFTNPAQAYNDNKDAFDYNPTAAVLSWKKTMEMLRECL